MLSNFLKYLFTMDIETIIIVVGAILIIYFLSKIIDKKLPPSKPIENQANEQEHDATFKNHDAEKQRRWLRSELEFQYQPENYQMRANPNKNITLGALLNTFDIKKEEIGNMYIVSNYLEMNGYLIQDEENIWEYDLFSAFLVDKKEKIKTKKDEQVILNIVSKRYKHESETDDDIYDKYGESDDLIIVHLRESGGFLEMQNTGIETVYICATICIPPPAWAKQRIAVTDYARLQGKIISITIAYDLRNPEEKLAEFRYIKEDAIEKFDNNRAGELSDMQRFILSNINGSNVADFYFGKKSIDERCWENAIVYFQNIYENLNFEWFRGKELSDDDKWAFLDSCYWLGFCFNELELYEKSLCYLNIGYCTDNIYYKMEYINCLVNKKDFRAFDVVVSELNRISEMKNHAKRLLNEYEDYYLFLLQKIAYLYIAQGKLDEAENILQEMLNKNQNEELAIDWLAYIQELRLQQSKQ